MIFLWIYVDGGFLFLCSQCLSTFLCLARSLARDLPSLPIHRSIHVSSCSSLHPSIYPSIHLPLSFSKGTRTIFNVANQKNTPSCFSRAISLLTLLTKIRLSSCMSPWLNSPSLQRTVLYRRRGGGGGGGGGEGGGERATRFQDAPVKEKKNFPHHGRLLGGKMLADDNNNKLCFCSLSVSCFLCLALMPVEKSPSKV